MIAGLHGWKTKTMTALAAICLAVFVFTGSAVSGLVSHAVAAPADVFENADGTMLVSVPGQGDILLPSGTAKQIAKIMRTDQDEEAENQLTRLMQSEGPSQIGAISILAATADPDRTALVAAAAIRADEEAGIKAANALRYVRGTNKRQILLGAHSSGNRTAYRRVRGAFAQERNYMAGGGPGGGANRDIGNAADRARGVDNPLGIDRLKGRAPLNRFQ